MGSALGGGGRSLDARPRTVGIIADAGTGEALAKAIASRGVRVMLYTGSRTRSPPKHGIERVARPAEIAAECGIMLINIEDTDDVRALILGSADRAGFGVEMQAESVLVDLGVRPPRETQSFLGLLGMRGVSVIDAAIVGSNEAIASGTAMVLVGGFPDAVEEALPVLQLLGGIERTGPLGSAHTAAALMGYMEAAHVVARDEALSVGAALGLPGATLARVLDGDSTSIGGNVVSLKRRTEIARGLAEERGLSADVIDLTRTRFSNRNPADK